MCFCLCPGCVRTCLVSLPLTAAAAEKGGWRENGNTFITSHSPTVAGLVWAEKQGHGGREKRQRGLLSSCWGLSLARSLSASGIYSQSSSLSPSSQPSSGHHRGRYSFFTACSCTEFFGEEKTGEKKVSPPLPFFAPFSPFFVS